MLRVSISNLVRIGGKNHLVSPSLRVSPETPSDVHLTSVSSFSRSIESFQDTLPPSSYTITHEEKSVKKQRAKINKIVWRHMKQQNSSDLEIELEKLRSNVVPLDEKTYVTMLFGYLLLPKQGIPAAESVLSRLSGEDFIHPVLKRALSRFLGSLKLLAQYDAFPNRTAVLKAYIPFMEIATQVKEKRQKAERGFSKQAVL